MSWHAMGYKSKNIGYTSTYMQLSVSAHSFEYVVKHKHKSLKDPYITRVLGTPGPGVMGPHITQTPVYTHTFHGKAESHITSVSH